MLDKKLIPEVQQLALTLLQKYPKIADSIIIRWIGTKEQYGQIG